MEIVNENVVTLALYMMGAVSMAVTVIWNIVRLLKTKECRKKECACENMHCIWRHSCRRYDNRKEILLSMIEYLKLLIQREEMRTSKEG